MSLLGLDVGTTGCKAVVFTEDGVEIAKAYREYPLLHPFTGSAELDPVIIWDSVSQVLIEVNSKVRYDPVKSLAVSSQGETCVPVDRNGTPLYNFVVTFDNRTVEQQEWWAKRSMAKRIFSITGMPLHSMYTLNKLMWFKKHEPEVYKKAWKFLCCEDFVIYKLTGEPAIDYSMASRTMAFNIVDRKWSDEMLAAAEIEREKFSKVLPSASPVETVAKKTAKMLGFNENVVVATGGHDQPCGALGAGIIHSGDAMNATGTSDVICPAMEKAVLSNEMLDSNYCCYPHVYENFYCSVGFNLTGGLLLRWYRDTFCMEESIKAKKEGKDTYDIIFESMSNETRDLFFLPHFVGSGTPTLDSRSRGAILGLTLDVRKPQIARAVIDSINYEMKYNIETMEKVGIKIEKLTAIGGGAKNPRWLQMKADVFEKSVYLLENTECAAFGAALLAGKAISLYQSLHDAVKSMVKIKERFEPDTRESKIYLGKYERYKSIYNDLKCFNHNISRVQSF